MRRIPLTVLFVGLAAYGLLFTLFPRYDASPRFNLSLNRQEAVGRVRSIGLQSGLEVQEWAAYARVNLVEQTVYYQHRQPDQSGLFVSSALSQVRLVGPEEEFLSVSLTSEGSLYRFERKRPSLPEELAEQDQGEDSQEEAVDEPVLLGPQEVEQALRLIAGEFWDRFSQSKDPEVRNGITTMEFTAPELAGPDRVPHIVIQAVGDEIYSIRGDPGFSDSFDGAYDDLEDPLEMVLIFVIFATFLGIAIGLARFALGIFDRAAEYRSLIVLVAIVVATDFAQFCIGEGWQQAGFENDEIIEIILVLFLKYAFTITPVLIATLGAGAIVAQSGSIQKTIHLELLLGGGIQGSAPSQARC